MMMMEIVKTNSGYICNSAAAVSGKRRCLPVLIYWHRKEQDPQHQTKLYPCCICH